MVRKFSIEEARIEPLVTLAVMDNWIEFTIRYIVRCKKRRMFKDPIMRSILLALDEHRDSALLASMTVELANASLIASDQAEN